MGVPKGMTVKQQKFCKFYSVHRILDRAAYEAEVPLETAREWMKLPKIQETWQRYRGEWMIKSGCSPEEIMAHLIGIIQDPRQSTKDRLTGIKIVSDIYGMTEKNKTSSEDLVINLGSTGTDDEDEIEELEEEGESDERRS